MIGAWRSLVAHLHGVQGVGASNAIAPILFGMQRFDDFLKHMNRGVAQLGSAPASGAGGRKFKSSRPDHALVLHRRPFSAVVVSPPRSQRARLPGNFPPFLSASRDRFGSVPLKRIVEIQKGRRGPC